MAARHWIGLACLGLVLGSGAGAPAQEAAPVSSPILTIDQDRLYAESLWGKRAEAEIKASMAALQAENNKIEGELTAEELSLTDRRPKMKPEDFRKLADDFDARVTDIRQAQDNKSRQIAADRDKARQAFLTAALPVMAKLLQAKGAVAILDNRAVFVSARSIDATDDLRQRLDQVLGAGPDLPADLQTGQPAPATGGN
jgi:Skp family chaperone for outer membrane proteins